MNNAKTKRIIGKTTALAGALALAAAFTFPIGTEITGISFGNAIVASAEEVASGTCGENLTWTIDSDKKLTISGSGAMSDWTSSENAPWYSYKYSISSVEICDGVTSVGKYAFNTHSNLKSVTISNSVESIGSYAFNGCSGLTSIAIPDSVLTIENSAFHGCDMLTEITFGENSKLTTVGSLAFYGCKSLSSFKIPKNLDSLTYSAIDSCSGLTSIDVSEDNNTFCSIDGVLFNKEKTSLLIYPDNKSGESYDIPAGVISINEHAFDRNNNLKSVTIPDSVESIGDAFSNCENLASVTLPSNSSFTSIATGTFKNCTSLSKIIIPNSVETIGASAFAGCTSLESVTLPFNSSFTSIANYTFKDCTSLTSIIIPDNVESIGLWAFWNCTSLKSVEFSLNSKLTSIDDYAFDACSSLESIVLPESLDSLGLRAFRDCTSLEKATFLGKVNTVNRYIFRNCTNLSCVIYPKGRIFQQHAEINENANLIEYTIGDNDCVTISEITLGTYQVSAEIPETIGIYTVASVAPEYRPYVGKHKHVSVNGAADISCSRNDVSININCPICGKVMTGNYAFNEVSDDIVYTMKSQDIQQVIDFVNYSTAETDTDILTPGQLTAIDYVLAHDFGVTA